MNKSVAKNIFIGLDGEDVPYNIKKGFNLIQGLDTRFIKKQKDREVFDFVGLINSKDSSLAVFPKHFFSVEQLKKIEYDDIQINEDIQLLFDTIYKYMSNRRSEANSFAGQHVEFESDYPFSSFFMIYRYFQQFGIYKENYTHTRVGYNGKISWKETIKNSTKVISQGNIIHLPLYIKQNKSKQVFISDCMSFAIDYTLDRFSYLFIMPKTNNLASKFDYLNNLEYVINRLNTTKNSVFKDLNKNLIQDLIDFFTGLDENKNTGGDIHVKVKYFNLVWEKMIEDYLNNHFLGLNNNELIFSDNKIKSEYKFSRGNFKIDESENNFEIKPDHYFIDKNLQFIFDAKYYNKLKKFNYKQFSYHEILKHKIAKEKTISALIVPSESSESSNVHFLLDDKFIGEDGVKTKIILQKIKIKDVMRSYVK